MRTVLCGYLIFGFYSFIYLHLRFSHFIRNLEHSTIIYESPNYSPLLRVKWSHIEPNYLATLILDTRQPSMPMLQLTGHTSAANSIDWAPLSQHYLASGSDDSNAYIWDLRSSPKEIKGLLCFTFLLDFLINFSFQSVFFLSHHRTISCLSCISTHQHCELVHPATILDQHCDGQPCWNTCWRWRGLPPWTYADHVR